MPFDALDFVRIEGEFLTLGGGDIWSRVEEVAWQRAAIDRAGNTAKQQNRRSRQHGRLAHCRAERERRARNRQVVARVRACKHCGRTFSLTAAQLADVRKYDKRKGGARSGRFCTRSCFGRYNRARNVVRPVRMVAIDGVVRTLSEWAAHFGISQGMVYRRLRAGLSEVEALTQPKARRGRS